MSEWPAYGSTISQTHKPTKFSPIISAFQTTNISTYRSTINSTFFTTFLVPLLTTIWCTNRTA
jgi:hypothetical protein